MGENYTVSENTKYDQGYSQYPFIGMGTGVAPRPADTTLRYYPGTYYGKFKQRLIKFKETIG